MDDIHILPRLTPSHEFPSDPAFGELHRIGKLKFAVITKGLHFLSRSTSVTPTSIALPRNWPTRRFSWRLQDLSAAGISRTLASCVELSTLSRMLVLPVAPPIRHRTSNSTLPPGGGGSRKDT